MRLCFCGGSWRTCLLWEGQPELGGRSIGVNRHGQGSFHGERVGESSPLDIKAEPGKDQRRDSLCSVDKISNSVS